MRNAIVIDPVGFDEKAAWQECDDWEESHGRGTMAAAVGADPGICSCPACHEMYWAWGHKQRCVVCQFEYPTDAWAMFSWGTQAQWRRGKGLEEYDANRMWHPYFCYGYELGPTREVADAHKGGLHGYYEAQDWRTIMASYDGHTKHEKPKPKQLDPEVEQMLERYAKARPAIVEHIGGPWKRGTPSARGAVDCPVCGVKGGLHFSRAGYNGHIHAKCSADGCVAWME